MKTINVNETTIVLAHVVSFALSDEEVHRGKRGLVLRIRLTNRDEIVVADDDLARVHAQLRKAFGARRGSSPSA